MEIKEGITPEERRQEVKNRLEKLLGPVRPGDTRPLANIHHRVIVEEFYINHPEVPFPDRILQVNSWEDLKHLKHLKQELKAQLALRLRGLRKLGETDLVFVDGGILEEKLGVDVGRAILINDGGIIKANIRCGRFHKDGGIIGDKVSIEERLLIGTNQK
ncbi:hypothetical protein CO054_02745 [Candidatus Shapirobacteria bacterium CG_4_9_14_0_2_um_filter_39_11]|uniref:Uncharacterized protein n=1 Tax=Candidatus Shapirobacteria bacterium CG_4_9_14_0_2_um_filter_39_11 TaxID=1974478 RepID=A0A2M8ES55_9BACT|nr:MAG: hypothetical protein CO054_02745 [Candidatus Shapirobacteria bacterium CG_4_9_14_0_2_um_filter_39_11]